MVNSTLLFLLKRQDNVVTEICLAMKKRGHGAGKWNGTGGKEEPIDENIKATARRETFEEIGVKVGEIIKVGKIEFEFLSSPDTGQLVHIYTCVEWEGEPIETDEMSPAWFNIENIPYSQMWTDDAVWLPLVLEGQFVEGKFQFDGEEITNYELSSGYPDEIRMDDIGLS